MLFYLRLSNFVDIFPAERLRGYQFHKAPFDVRINFGPLTGW